MDTLHRLLFAKALRGFADGFVSLLLPLHLLHAGFSPWQVGVIATVTLFGSGVMTLAVGTYASRYTHRTLLLAATALMAATGMALASFHSFWPILLVAFVGTINPSGGDASVFLPLEHALLARSASDRGRTGAFARYSLVGSLAGAFGALAAGLPSLAAARFGIEPAAAVRAMFFLYAFIAVPAAWIYRGLAVPAAGAVAHEASSLGPSRRRVLALAGLFSLDAFGGGFIVQSLVALWLFQRFGLAVETAGSIFFCMGVLSALSFLAAARLAGRIGLVPTMVFTHIPANLCAIAIPFCPDLGGVIALLFVRSALSQMDVPTRSSYVMAIVQPHERAAAASVTSVPRSLAAAASPAIAGWMLGFSAFGWPLVAGGAIKIVYDLLLLAMFRRVRPPEEMTTQANRAPAGP